MPLKDKICIVTGANGGIGKATAMALAEKRAEVHMICRNEEKAKEALRDIEARGIPGKTRYWIADLSSLNDIKRLAEELNRALPRVDVLVNNAGGMFDKKALSADGREMTLALNHFGYFLLTNLLMDKLLKAPAGRVVSVSSEAHRFTPFDWALFDGNVPYKAFQAYAFSKLCNIMFTYELAARLKNTTVTANCLHPGVVASNFVEGMGLPGFLKEFVKLFMVSNEKGAETSVYLASSAEVTGLSGLYFAKKRQKKPKHPANDPFLCQQLWQKSEEACGIKSML
jgi:NAD(P)-dependent dehydrogenase (short-subunit alcohol dehydrogenase family)